MGRGYACAMCGQPILEAGHVEGYLGRMETWVPLHERCAENIRKVARRTGKEGPILRDGFSGTANSAGGMC